MEETLSDAIANYIEQRKQVKLEPLQKVLNKVLEARDEITIAEAKVVYAKAAEPIEIAYKPNAWLTDAAKRAKQISLATHAAKFTHSDAKASSVLVSNIDAGEGHYLSTAVLAEKAIDAVGNAAALDVAKLLKIQVNNESLVSQLQNDDADALHVFTDDAEQLNHWKEGFKQALGDEKLSSHTLSKQLYFPLPDNDYHLICPLFSSALTHKLYYKVTSTRFGDAPKDVREARRKGFYHEQTDIAFPNTAVQNFGGSKPQNISQLNSERYGQSFLLNAAPPKWQSQTKPPVHFSTLFNRQFSFRVGLLLREFKTFLANLRQDERNFKVRYKRDQQFILPIIDELMNYAASIQLMPSGWSLDQDRKLKVEHALWLDVGNPDESFQREREKGNWLSVVAADFATWLTRQLKNDEYYKLSDTEHAWFEKLCLKQLQRFERATPKLGES
jgi:CRISPR-associated protein Csy1